VRTTQAREEELPHAWTHKCPVLFGNGQTNVTAKKSKQRISDGFRWLTPVIPAIEMKRMEILGQLDK
jgi:hypothetical protein